MSRFLRHAPPTHSPRGRTRVDSTMAVEFVGSTVNVYLDGVLVGHATSTRNQSAIGTAVGMVGEGNSRRVRSIAVTV